MNNLGIDGNVSNNMLDKMQTVLADPSADILMTSVFFGIILLLFALIAAIGYLVYGYSNKDRLQFKIEVPTTENPYEQWIHRLIIVTVLAAFVALSSSYIDKPAFCVNCHSNAVEAKTLAKTVHSGLSCLQCHQQPGFTGAILQKIDYARWATIYARTNKAEARHAIIKNDACLACHRSILQQVKTTHSIRVRHKDFIENGARCVDCHNSIAHPGVIKPEQSPSMAGCVSCHNGKIAKSKCQTCHAKDIGDKMRLPKRDRLKVGVSVKWNFCYRCHENKKCAKCHGVTMPHPPDWVSGVKHARPAFININVCWKCHDSEKEPFKPSPLVSCACHGVVNEYHEPEPFWIKKHGPIALGKMTGDGMNERCYNCHGKKLCDFCHDAGKYKASDSTSTVGAAEEIKSIDGFHPVESTGTVESTSSASDEPSQNESTPTASVSASVSVNELTSASNNKVEKKRVAYGPIRPDQNILQEACAPSTETASKIKVKQLK